MLRFAIISTALLTGCKGNRPSRTNRHETYLTEMHAEPASTSATRFDKLTTDYLREATHNKTAASVNVIARQDSHSVSKDVSGGPITSVIDRVGAKSKAVSGVDSKNEGPLMDMITKFRAQKCHEMKEEHGEDFGSYEKCLEFMKAACKPGKDMEMDGGKSEVSSGSGFCENFFPQDEPEELKKQDEELLKKVKAEKEAAKKEGAEEGAAAAAAKKETAEKEAAKKNEAEKAGAAESDGSVTAASTESSETGGQQSESHGKSGNATNSRNGTNSSDNVFQAANDNKWYSDMAQRVIDESGPKMGNDGATYPKDFLMDRLLKSESSGLPTQGFKGPLVEHNDGKTSTGDWLREHALTQVSVVPHQADSADLLKDAHQPRFLHDEKSISRRSQFSLFLVAVGLGVCA